MSDGLKRDRILLAIRDALAGWADYFTVEFDSMLSDEEDYCAALFNIKSRSFDTEEGRIEGSKHTLEFSIHDDEVFLITGEDNEHDVASATLMAVLYFDSLCNTAPPAQAVEAVELRGVAEVLAEGDGFWRECSGCYEVGEYGQGSSNYPHSKVFGCRLGGGCSECGGVGAIWDATDYEAMANSMAASMGQTVSPPTAAPGAEGMPPEGYPLRKLGARLAELLDEDHFAECEALLLAAAPGRAREGEAVELTLENAPLGTQAPAINGGHWLRVQLGWKWWNGATFHRPGGDWNGKLIPPTAAPGRAVSDERDPKAEHLAMIAAHDKWMADDSTHWISDYDAGYQGFMAAWELQGAELDRLRALLATPAAAGHAVMRAFLEGWEMGWVDTDHQPRVSMHLPPKGAAQADWEQSEAKAALSRPTPPADPVSDSELAAPPETYTKAEWAAMYTMMKNTAEETYIKLADVSQELNALRAATVSECEQHPSLRKDCCRGHLVDEACMCAAFDKAHAGGAYPISAPSEEAQGVVVPLEWLLQNAILVGELTKGLDADDPLIAEAIRLGGIIDSRLLSAHRAEEM